jgi:hypothetical protein
MAILEMQWILYRVLALAGAADPSLEYVGLGLGLGFRHRNMPRSKQQARCESGNFARYTIMRSGFIVLWHGNAIRYELA